MSVKLEDHIEGHGVGSQRDSWEKHGPRRLGTAEGSQGNAPGHHGSSPRIHVTIPGLLPLSRMERSLL